MGKYPAFSSDLIKSDPRRRRRNDRSSMNRSIFLNDLFPKAMEFSTLTIILTDRCNFCCSYCYQNKKNRQLDIATITRAIDFFYPRLTRECFINFYGGEPLLAFNRLEETVAYLESLNRRGKLKIHYSLSTNGSLLNEDILRFLHKHAFSLVLSFDGWAQEICREKGSFDRIVSLIPEIIKRRRISLETNSVFTPKTIGHLAASIRLLLLLGVPKIHAGVSYRMRWNPASLKRLKKEIATVRNSFLDAYERMGDIPWVEMAEANKKGVYRCDAGREQMALSADGKLWGCFLFPHYFDGKNGKGRGEKYCFGRVDAFLRDPEAIYVRTMSAIAGLGMDSARTPLKECVLCGDIESCWICPIAAAFSSRAVGTISLQACRLARMMREERDLFSRGFEDKKRKRNPTIKAAGFS